MANVRKRHTAEFKAKVAMEAIRQQCGLLGLNRSGLYYQPAGESVENLALMRLLDEQYTRTPCYGVLRMAAYLQSLGHGVNPKGPKRLLRTMGLEAVYQRPNTSQPNPRHKTYPYLLRGLPIDRCDQVLGTEHHAGRGLLRRGGGEAAGRAAVRDIQHRPGRTVHYHALYPAAAGQGRQGQHGWARAGAGQHFRGTALAHGQV